MIWSRVILQAASRPFTGMRGRQRRFVGLNLIIMVGPSSSSPPLPWDVCFGWRRRRRMVLWRFENLILTYFPRNFPPPTLHSTPFPSEALSISLLSLSHSSLSSLYLTPLFLYLSIYPSIYLLSRSLSPSIYLNFIYVIVHITLSLILKENSGDIK